MEGIMKKVCQPSGAPSMAYSYQMGLHMNTVENHMRSEVDRLRVSTRRSYPGPSSNRPTNRFAALYDVGDRSTIDDLGRDARDTWEKYKWQLEQPPQPSQGGGHSSGSGGGTGPPSSFGGGPRGSYGSGRGAGGSSKGKSSESGGRSGGSGPNQYSSQNQYQLIDLKYDVEGFDTPARPLLCYSVDSRIGGTPCARSLDTDERIVLELDARGARTGSHASTFRGTVHRRDHSDIHIFLKTYPRNLLDSLDRELTAYNALRKLPCVPRVLALIVEPHGDYAGLLLEDAGTQVGNGNWDDVQLSAEDRIVLYSALKQIHAAGVVHWDMAPRNVVRGPQGALSIIDFESAIVGHDCTGDDCKELGDLSEDLRL
ncbi:hypothetical protein B0H14DRAFT_2887420, partial [Mycena olivaceomarginata]